MKKALRETQTLRAKNSRPAADPLPWGAGPPKFNQLEMVTTCTYRPSLVKIDHAISRYRGNRHRPPARCKHTHTHTHTHTQTGPITVHCASSAQCNKGRKEGKKTPKTVANWLFAQTTHVVGSKSNFAWWVACGVKCHPYRSRGYGAVGGRKWPFPITLAIGLYNSLYHRTSRDIIFPV